MSQVEIRNPNSLVIITEAWMKQHSDLRDTVDKYYDLRADRSFTSPAFNVFVNQVKEVGRIHDPVKIAKVDGIGDVVVDGRQRTRAAQVLKFETVPVIIEDEDSENVISVELSSNLARSENSVLENAAAFKKALQKGLSKEKVAVLAGISVPSVYNTILLGEMPKEIHKMIDSGQLSATAALQLKSFGKKASKGSGLSMVYDDEAKKKMIEFVNSLDLEAKLKGGGKKLTVGQARQANNSSARVINNLTPKEWDYLVTLDSTPEDYAVLIRVLRNQLTIDEATKLHPENLGWLHRPEVPKKEKPAKEPKEGKKRGRKAKDSDGEEIVTDVETNGLDFGIFS